jgi:hypothetical protein
MSKQERIQELNELISIAVTVKAFAETQTEYEQAEADFDVYNTELAELLLEDE